VAEEILHAVSTALDVFVDCGARRVEQARSLPFAEEFYRANRAVLPPEAATYHNERLETRADDFGADVFKRLRAGADTSAADYAQAKRRQVELTRALELWFEDVDVLVTPTTRVVAPRVGEDAVAMARHLTAFTAPFNLTGFPAISIPCGFTRERLPIGLQLIARPWQEALLLQVAHQFQRATEWHSRMPK
jgi:aspartyl-tRNA(Asn)/glutamyl-tRNA(Gln) amidotransferase subunit A